MRARTYRNYENRLNNDCNIKINNYNVAYVINKVASEQNISKSKLIENLIYEKYAGYFHNIPESLDSIIDNMKRNLEGGFFEEYEGTMEYYISRLENLKKENK
jgi:hypothetical protein